MTASSTNLIFKNIKVQETNFLLKAMITNRTIRKNKTYEC